MIKEREPILLHPFLLAVFPILFLYSRNMGEFPLGVVSVPLLKSLLLTTAGLALLRIPFFSWPRAGIVASAFLLLFYSYGHLRVALYGLPIDMDALPLKAHTILFPSASILFAVVSILVLRSRNRFGNLTRILNAAAVLLVIFSAAEITAYKVTTREAETFEVDHSIFGPADSGLSAPQEPPDIYYIVLDAYPRADNLLELYHHDNGRFVDFLASRGFFVAREATSNYSRTILSLASSMNFSYMDTLATIVGAEQTNLRPIRRLIEQSRAREVLARFGYRFIAIRSGFQNTELKGADLYLTPGQRGEFEAALVRTTAASPVNAWFSRVSDTVAGAHREKDRERIMYAFEQIPKAASSGRPVFVFAHIVAPHPPFVFDRDGKDVESDRYFAFSSANDLIRREGLTRTEYRDRFLDQLIFINQKVRSLVDSLIEDSPTPPIIILRGDHGPGTFSHHSNLHDTYLGDRMSILYAASMPGVDDSLLYHSMTPVNTFRVMFNGLFGGTFPMLEDRNFYTTRENPYRFIEVTGEVGGKDDRERLDRLMRTDYYP